MNFFRFLHLSFFLTTFLVPLLPAEPEPGQDPAPARPVVLPKREYRVVEVVATVGETPIFQHQLDAAMRSHIDPSRLAQLPQEQRQAALEQIERAVLNDLVGRILLVNAARSEGLQISQEDLRKRMEADIARMTGGKSVDAYLKETNVDADALLKQIEEELLIDKLIEAKTRDLPQPTEDEAKQYYEKNPSEFQQAANVRIRTISLSTRGLTNPIQIDAKRQRLEEIRKRLLDDPKLNFAVLARQESEAASALQGGSIGPFGRGQRAVEPELEEASFTQNLGEIGPVIATRSGFHLIRVEEKNPPRTLRFDEVRGPILTYLRQMKCKDVMVRLVEQWSASTKVVRVKQKPASPPSAPQNTDGPAPSRGSASAAAP